MKYVQATMTYATQYEGETVTINRGELIDAAHPLVLANPDRFRAVEQSSRWGTVEQATAAPGEQRDPGRSAPRQSRPRSTRATTTSKEQAGT